MATELLKDLWDKQSVWSLTADRLKNGIARARLAALYIVVAVAVCGTMSGVVADIDPTASRVLAAAAALGAAGLPLLRPRWSGRALQDWTRARSVSEALKSEVYLYLGGVGRYSEDPDGALLRKKTDKVRQDGNDLLEYQLGIKAVQRDLPAVQDIASYFSVRVTGQIDDYYTAKARELRTRLRWFRGIETVLAVTGATLGLIAAAGVGGSAILPHHPDTPQLQRASLLNRASRNGQPASCHRSKEVRDIGDPDRELAAVTDGGAGTDAGR